MTTTLGKKGQVVIPQELRERLALRPGDDLLVDSHAGKIVMEKIVPTQHRATLVLRKGQLPTFKTPKGYVLTSERVKELADGILE
jgi:AbrB family looped-hinge helix DNA binding protein